MMTATTAAVFHTVLLVCVYVLAMLSFEIVSKNFSLKICVKMSVYLVSWEQIDTDWVHDWCIVVCNSKQNW